MTTLLYKLQESWGLPSLSVSCIQAEAYLRLAKAPFCVQTCTSSTNSPTGKLPALEQGPDMAAPSAKGEYGSAQNIIAFLKTHGADLDQHLSAAQRAEVYAFNQVIAAALNPATTYTTWVEGAGFAEYRKAAYGSSLPFPLSYIVPWSERRDVISELRGRDPEEVYAAATEALTALADRLRNSPGKFFFGSRPSSLDALMFGHLLWYRSAPVTAPVLRHKVLSSKVLCDYVDHIMAEYFSTPAPTVPEEGLAGEESAWSEAAQGQAKAKGQPTAEDARHSRASKMWMAGAAAAIAAYVLLSGNVIQVLQYDDDIGDDDDDDE